MNHLLERWRERFVALVSGLQSRLEPESEELASDKRSVESRLPLQIPVLCKAGGRDIPAQVTDISAHGMRLRLSVRLEPDDTIFVTSGRQEALNRPQQVNCRVAWARSAGKEFEAGLAYNESDENVYQAWLSLAERSRVAS